MRPFPSEFLDWQVKLRHWTVTEKGGMPQPGVVPLVLVRAADHPLGAVAHSVVCGLLPRKELLEQKTKEFRALYEELTPEGKDVVYQRGLAYLRDYYAAGPEAFDPASVTTLLPADTPLVKALRADPRCALLFHVFDMSNTAPGGAIRCQQLACRAELLTEGPVHDNVWWHNTLFHGPAEGHVVVHFQHERSFDTRFGRLEVMRT